MLTPDDFAAVAGIFDEVVDLQPAERAAAIAMCDRWNVGMHGELASLLAAHDQAGDFMRPADREGVVIGAWRMHERIGAGGMGDVYRAERADGAYVGAAAIKLMRTHMRDADSSRRFRTERQILASLQHANIVTLLDGGTTADGQAFLVMELVEGTTVSRYCQSQALGLDARVGLMQRVCDAVQYAHQRGIVHRDLKPTNILVTADGVPKVLDFGVAKLLEETADNPSTRASVLGPLTPNYASPEQLRGLPVTTACDVYSLGVLLYEILGGARPYETTGMTLDAVLTTVVETQPPRPSLATSGEALPYPRARLRGDLDAIVLKAMRKEPEQRYGSAGALGDDLGRLLRGEPVVAREPSAGYLLRRLAGRHRAAVAIAAAACIAVLSALGFALWQRQAAVEAQGRAETRFREVRQLSNALIFKLHDSVAKLPGSTPVRRQIVNEALSYMERLAAESAGDPVLQLELAAAYRQIASILGDPAFPNLGDVPGAIVEANKSRQLLEAAVDVDTAGELALASVVDTHTLLRRLYSSVSDRPKAIAMAEEAVRVGQVAMRRSLPESRSMLAKSSYALASMVEPREAKIPHWQLAERLYGELLAEKPDDPERQRNVALVDRNFGGLLVTLGRRDEGQSRFERALALDEKRLAAAPANRQAQLDSTYEYSQLAWVMELKGDDAGALALQLKGLGLRVVLAESDPQDVLLRGRVAWTRTKVAELHLAVGDAAAALSQARRAVADLDHLMSGKTTGPAGSNLGVALLMLGQAEWAGGERVPACRHFVRAMAVLTANPPVPDSALYLKQSRDRVAQCRGE